MRRATLTPAAVLPALGLPGCIVGDIHDEMVQLNENVVNLEIKLDTLDNRLLYLERLVPVARSLDSIDDDLASVKTSLGEVDTHLASLRRTINNIDSTIPFLKIADEETEPTETAEIEAAGEPADDASVAAPTDPPG